MIEVQIEHAGAATPLKLAFPARGNEIRFATLTGLFKGWAAARMSIVAEHQRTHRFRLAGLLGFVVAMPILALPAVNERLDSWLFAAPAPTPRGAKVAAKRDWPAAVDATAAVPPAPADAGGMKGAPGATGVPESAPLPPTATDPSLSAARSDRRGGDDGAAGNVERLPPADLVVDLRQFAACQTRLQELGAAYFRLEDTGQVGARYRFRCEVPLPGNGSYLRPFEQEHDDPLEAMRQTVAEVEQWCAAHRTRKAVLTLPPNK